MKIGIIGSGDVGQSLGKGISAIGHDVMLGSRHPDKPELAELKAILKLGDVSETAAFGEMVILAVKGTVVEQILPKLRDQLAKKIVIDVTNPLVFDATGSPGLSVGHTNSGGEVAQHLLPNSSVVKTLNIINHAHMCQPKYEQGTATMFLAGDDLEAKKQVSQLLKELGWQDLTDLGGIEHSRLLEPLCLLWVKYGLVNNTWNHAFAVLKK